jgi:hypothetical protein
MGRFSETWQHPGIYNLIDHSSNLLSTCSRVSGNFPSDWSERSSHWNDDTNFDRVLSGGAADFDH